MIAQPGSRVSLGDERRRAPSGSLAVMLSQWTRVHWAPQQWREGEGSGSVTPPSVQWRLGQGEQLMLKEGIASKIKRRPHGKP
jgi:hypothetical protein